MTFERMMSTGESWEPTENMVRLDLIFKQMMMIKGFTVKCNTELTILIDSDAFPCKAPSQHFATNIVGSMISLTVIGDKISISGISFDYEAAESAINSLERPLPMVSYVPIRSKTVEVKTRKLSLIPLFDGPKVPLCGFELNEAAPIKSLVCALATDEGEKFFRFCLPRFRGAERILLPTPVECSGVILYFTESYETFSMPQVKLLASV